MALVSRRRVVTAALALLACGAARADAAAAGGVMTYVHHPSESALDVRYLYHWEILRTALDKTTPTWGPYRMVPSAPMSERRQAHELQNATGKLTVMYLGTTPAFEATLVPVRIPVDRNLCGYGVFLVRAGDEGRFAAVRTVADLRRFSFGLGLGWLDVGILEAAGLRVVTGSSYDGLFEMLVNRRFDVFLRGAVEVLDELEQRKDWRPGMRIEDRLILYYPLPMYFWFARNDEGRRLAARAEEGMRAMIADGTYDAIFDRHQRSRIERLRLSERTILRIDNPLLGPETPFGDKRLWFDPVAYR